MDKNTKHPLLDLLGEGEGNARRGKELGALLGVDDTGIRAMVNSLRKDGVPICSNQHGYFLPANDAEARACGRSLRARANDQLKAAKVFLIYENPAALGETSDVY